MKTVTIIIPVYGREDVFQTITQLKQLPDTFCWHAVIIDNGNVPERSQRLATLNTASTTVLRLEHNRGGAGAFRAGMQFALRRKDEFVWLLDDDALINEQTLAGLVNEYLRLEASGLTVGALGSTILGRKNPDRITEVGCLISPLLGRVCQRYKGDSFAGLPPETTEVEYVAAASLLVRRTVLEKVGIFEDIFIHWDDIEWCMRLRKLGYHNFATTRSYVNHLEGINKAADWVHYYDTRNQLWCLTRHHRFARWGAHLYASLRYIIARLHGRHTFARLLQLGMQHAKTGACLLRAELPPAPPFTTLEETLHPNQPVAVFMYHNADMPKWQSRLSKQKTKLLGYIGPHPMPINLLRTSLRQLTVQWWLLRHPNARILIDCTIVKRYPIPLFGRPKSFYWDLPDGLRIFQEEK